MVAQSLFWMALPAMVYGLLASLLLREDPPPRWQVRLRAVAARLHRRGSSPTPRPADPFDVLAVQVRLGLLAAQLQTLADDPRIWARAKRYQATERAYDDVLAEACRLAGIEPHDADGSANRRTTEPERFRAEVELASRGWSW